MGEGLWAMSFESRPSRHSYVSEKVGLHFFCAMTSKPLNRLILNIIDIFFMMPRCILSILFAELLLKRCTNQTLFNMATTLNRLTDWAEIFRINSLQHLNALSFTFFRWCKVLTLLSHIYHYIISIYKAIGCQWLVCLFAFWSLTPPKQQTPIRWNFETWFRLGCRGFQAKKTSGFVEPLVGK